MREERDTCLYLGQGSSVQSLAQLRVLVSLDDYLSGGNLHLFRKLDMNIRYVHNIRICMHERLEYCCMYACEAGLLLYVCM